MLRKSRSKTAPNQEAGKDGAEKLPFKTRIKACWEAAGREMTDFRQNSAKSFGKWLLVYFLFALFSLLLLNADSDLKFKEFPTVFALIIPRMFTLFLFTCPILNMQKAGWPESCPRLRTTRKPLWPQSGRWCGRREPLSMMKTA